MRGVAAEQEIAVALILSSCRPIERDPDGPCSDQREASGYHQPR
jgi:hypothetical protein